MTPLVSALHARIYTKHFDEIAIKMDVNVATPCQLSRTHTIFYVFDQIVLQSHVHLANVTEHRKKNRSL